ncbi:hypothetical protein TWF730_007842 [Orbilia blumenaviensis]|uniref:Uncharacterized protein n=1 Tax=Orbilia blumenaviensis TaxID=1796055 RepID=A0AAV9VBL6_9PEZI
MVCTNAFERQQRSAMFWQGLRPRRPMMSLADFTKFLNDQDRIWPLEINLPLDEEGFDIEFGMSIYERRRHEDERYYKFEFTLQRLAGWLLRANAYPEKDESGSVTGVVEVWSMPKAEHIPKILLHSRIKYKLLSKDAKYEAIMKESAKQDAVAVETLAVEEKPGV